MSFMSINLIGLALEKQGTYRLTSSIWVFLKHRERAFNMLKHFVPISAVLLQFLGCYPGEISADGQLGDVYSDGAK